MSTAGEWTQAGSARSTTPDVQPRPEATRQALSRQLYDLLQHGRYRAAGEILDDARSRVPRDQLVGMTTRYLVERQRWRDALALSEEWLAADQGAGWYAKGIGAARAAWPGGTPWKIDIARAAARRLDELARAYGRRSLVEVRRLGILAAVAAAQEERDEMTVVLRHATEIADSFGPEQPVPALAIPFHELAGDLWLQVHRFADAKREYAHSVTRHPGRARSWYGLTLAAAQADDWSTVRIAATQFLTLWADADPDLQELDVARDYLKRATEPSREPTHRLGR